MNSGNISPKTIDIIRSLLAPGRTILELGSGEGTQRLADYGYKMISVEHSEKWLGKFDSQYIHAPISYCKPTKQFPENNQWYNSRILRDTLPKLEYDFLLIDGPPRDIGRGGMLKHREIFNWDVPVIFDDTQREQEWKVAYHIARRVGGRTLITYDTAERKMATLMLDNIFDLTHLKGLL